MNISKEPNPELKYQFSELRALSLNNCLEDVWIRLDEQKQIIPTEEEVRLTTIWELIEPQVRNAVRKMIQKGYCTTDSGFWGDMPERQFLSGLFKLTDDTKQLLSSKDILVEEEGSWTYIIFIPTKPDLDEIKQTWDEIVELLPDLGHIAKSRDEILHFDEGRIMQKLFENGKITEEDYNTFKENKNHVQEIPTRN